MCQEDSSIEILETQERKMNKNKTKKREITHFLGHYQLTFSKHHLCYLYCDITDLTFFSKELRSIINSSSVNLSPFPNDFIKISSLK